MVATDIKKRKRPSYVCTNCKKKKIRCDKDLPCGQCVRAECASSCVFEVSENNRIEKKSPPSMPYMVSAKRPLEFKKSEKVSRNGNQNQEEEATSELAMLKNKIREIEQKLQNNEENTQQPLPHIRDRNVYIPVQTNGNRSNFSSVQLPLNFKRDSMSIPSITSSEPRFPFDMSNGTSSSPSSFQLPGIFGKDPLVQLPPLKSNAHSSASTSSSHSTSATSLLGSPKNQSVSSNSPISEPCYVDVHALTGKNPYRNHNDVINFYANYTSIHEKDSLRRINFGPFAWATLMRRDLGLSILWDYIVETNDKNAASHNTAVFSSNKAINSYVNSSGNNPDMAFEKRALEADGYDDLLSYERRKQMIAKKSKINQNTLPLGLTFYDGNLDRELQLIDKIKIILPKKKVIWLLVRRFFTKLYPYLPYVDEVYFKTAISIIIGEFSLENEPITNLRVEKRLDLAHVGILLIMLRLSYLSLFSNKNSINERNLNSEAPCADKEVQYLLSNPINFETIDVAQLCLDQFQLLRRANVTVFQLAMFMRIYHTYAPEDGDGADGGDSQVMTSMLIQMGYSLGFHREPTKFKDACNDRKINHLARKIWLYLVVSDIYQAQSFGNPLNIDPNSFDTKVPWYEAGSENIVDTNRDKLVTASFFHCASGTFALREILDRVLDVKNGVNMAELCKLLSNHELSMVETFGTLEECLKPEQIPGAESTLNMKVKFYLSLKAFYISIYFHLYHFYEHRDIELCYFYVKKLILIAIGDIMPNYYALLGENESVFALVVNPTLELVIHRTIEILLACIVRVNFNIHNAKDNADHDKNMQVDKAYRHAFNTMCRLSSAMTRCAEVAISAILKISNRYYYAWRITKSQTYLLKAVTSIGFYSSNYRIAQDYGLCLMAFGVEMMEELTTICECTLLKLKCELTNDECGFNPKSSVANDIARSAQNSDTLGFPPLISSHAHPTPMWDKEHTPYDFRVDYVNNQEVDNLWLNMLALKQDSNIDGGTLLYQNADNTFADGKNEDDSKNASRWNLAPEQGIEFDIFRNLGFDRLFQGSE